MRQTRKSITGSGEVRLDDGGGSHEPDAGSCDESTAQTRGADDNCFQSTPAAEQEDSANALSREEWIRRAAYAAAQRRGFAPGKELDDWLEAELAYGASSIGAADTRGL